VTTLYLIDGFAIALVPPIGSVVDPLVAFLDVTISNPALGLTLAVIGGLAMWTLQALLFLREILLYVFVYVMPIGFAVAYGGLPVVSNVAMRVAVKFIPLAVMPLPVALLFRGYELLFGGAATAVTPDSAFFGYLIAVSLPVLSVWIIWKLFAYTTPRLVRTVSRATGLTVTAGAVVGAAAVAGPWAGATAVRWGPKAAIGQTVAHRIGRSDSASEPSDESSTGPTSTDATSAPTVRSHEGGWASYRRTENEPRP
jgi:type IV secretion system protein TrbL